MHEGLSCHRRVKLQQKESGTGQTFRCRRSCQSFLANISICVFTVASAVHSLMEQMNHPLLGQFELSVDCPSCLAWLVCFANQSIVYYNLFFLGLLHSLTSVPIYKFSHLWPCLNRKVKVTFLQISIGILFSHSVFLSDFPMTLE